MKRTVYFLLVLGLSGCGEADDVKTAVKGILKDPDSVKFEAVFVTKQGDKACAIFNAKNSFGGYAGLDVVELKKSNDKWRLSSEDLDPSKCTRDYYDQLNQDDETHKEFLKILNR